MFVLRMALRETRASWRRLLFFFVCIAVGVAAIVALRSVIQSVRAVFGSEAKSLIAADVLISTNRPWTPETRATIERRLGEYGALASSESVETPTMIRPADSGRDVARMSELRAVQPGFPLYGTLTLQGGATYSHDLLKGRGVLVRPELLTALGVQVGDRITIGQVPFTIRGVIQDEPGRRVGDFSLGPRVLIDFADLADTGLLTFGSRARSVILVKLPDPQVEPLVTRLKADFKDTFVNARSYRAQDDEIGRDFDRAENYLSMVGLVIVILGGIAVSSVTRVFVLQKMHSIAVLKCTGATSGQIMAIYMLQVMALGLAGSLLGVGLARAAVAAIPHFVDTASTATSMLADVQYGVTWSAAAQGLGIGVLVSLLFSVVPLLRVRAVKPSLLLRDESASNPGTDWVRVGAFALVTAGLVAVTAWQAASLKVGLIVCAGFAGLALILMLAGRLLVQLVAPLANTPSFPLRHAVLHLSRPGNQTRVILLAVGLGAFFIVGVRSLQSALLEQFSMELTANAPDMFLMDVQRGQADGVKAFLEDPARGTGPFRLIPVLRARVTGVQGRETNLESFEDVRALGSLGREYTITYRGNLEANEEIVEGRFWNGPSADAEVSVEEGINERFRVNIGDTIRFDILGRTVNARVSSIRRVDWKDSRNGGFMFVFRPGVLDNAPQMFIAPLKGPEDAAARARFQADLVSQFPNVSVIDFREILLTIQDVMSKVTLAISVVGGLVLFSGALILVGAVAMTKFQRVYEAAVFKTLGANTRTIARMLLFEYGVLGLLSGAVGSLGAVALSWGVSRYALDIPWRLFWAEHLGGVVLTALLVAAIGVLSSLDVLRNKPLLTLRAE
ncbi:MAG: ABC transporter permease [Vicinamibacterales bacterium]